MKYFEIIIDGDVLLKDDNEFNSFITELDPQFNEYTYILREAKYIEDWNADITFFECEDGKPDTKLFNNSNWLIFSDEAIEIFRQNDIQGFQYLPIKVYKKAGQRLEGYNYVANIYTKVECLDLEKSIYTLFGDEIPEFKGQIKYIKKIVLLQAKIPKNLDVFRIAEIRSRIIASEKFCRVFLDHKFTGLSFEEVELT